MAWRWMDLSVGLYVPLLEFNQIDSGRVCATARAANFPVTVDEQEQKFDTTRSPKCLVPNFDRILIL